MMICPAHLVVDLATEEDRPVVDLEETDLPDAISATEEDRLEVDSATEEALLVVAADLEAVTDLHDATLAIGEAPAATKAATRAAMVAGAQEVTVATEADCDFVSSNPCVILANLHLLCDIDAMADLAMTGIVYTYGVRFWGKRYGMYQRLCMDNRHS